LPNDELVVRCSHCKQFFSSEDFESHECNLPLINGAKEISVLYVREDNRGENKTIVARGTDGILYALVVESRKAIPIVSPIRRNFTATKSDKDFTESIIAMLIFSVLCFR
jgi:hypothetical protein